MTTTKTRPRKTNGADELFAWITNEIIRDLEDGHAGDWVSPWTKLASAGTPVSIDGRTYRGLNAIWLAMLAADRFASNTWGTYKAWKRHGCQVRRGEKGTAVIFWKPVTKTETTDAGEETKHQFLVARTYTVFAAEQVDGDEATELRDRSREVLADRDSPERIDGAQTWFDEIGATVVHGGDSACYIMSADTIRMPTLEQFHTAPGYYGTLAHEHTHWTGNEARLDRDLHNRFGSEAYAMEELVAELGAAMVAAQLGISATTRTDHLSYIAGWLKVLKQDPKALVTVASRAQGAVDFLNEAAGYNPITDTDTEEME